MKAISFIHSIGGYLCTILIFVSLSFQNGFAQSKDEVLLQFTDYASGISFDVPMGWVAHPIQGGYMLQSEAYDGYVLILPHAFRTKNDLKTYFCHELNASNHGIQLTRTSEFQHFNGRGIQAYFEGLFAWKKAKCCVISLVSPYYNGDGNGNGGFHIISGSMDPGKHKYFCKIATMVAGSMKLKSRNYMLVRR